MLIPNISLGSLNANGLNIQSKRRAIFRKMRQFDVVCLQETHSTENSAKFWTHEWGGGQCFFAHGTSNSRGVAIFVSKSFLGECKVLSKDNNGRFIILEIKTDNNTFTLCSVYAPTRDQHEKQIEFLDMVETEISKHDTENLLLCGDFNVYMNSELDSANPNRGEITESVYVLTLKECIVNLLLHDVWRIRNPNVRKFTFHRNEQASRIDYWFISDHLSEYVEKVEILAGIHSDHEIISLSFRNPSSCRGPGFWKFNSSLLADEEYVREMGDFIDSFENENIPNDPLLKWDFLKFRIKEFTREFSMRKVRERNKFKTDLENRLKTIQLLQDRGYVNENIMLEVNTLKKDLKEIETIKANYCIFRTKANWSQQGERCTKYFLGLEKRRSKSKNIQALLSDSGEVISDNKQILETERSFFEKLYSTPVPNDLPINERTLCLRDIEIQQISENNRDRLDGPIRKEELYEALCKMNKGKCPGSDGLSVEFYLAFWPGIAPYFAEAMKMSFETGLLTVEQRRGIITLIPKKDKDRRFIKNWRPISLLNVDYKIISKTLAIRLQSVIGTIIHSDQKGFIKGRNIGDGLREIDDLIQFYSDQNYPGIILSLDFEKAFDSLRWDFLIQTLETFGFGQNFRNWAKILFSNIQSCVINNGHCSAPFSPVHGVRQGCNISPLFFVLAVELLAIRIRNNQGIVGLKIHETCKKLNMFADDITCMLRDSNSVITTLTEIITFSRVSGLRLNRDKSCVLPIGSCVIREKEIQGIPVASRCKILGIHFFSQPNVYMHYSLNFKHIIDSIQGIISAWRNRNLSVRGKVVLFNALMISRLMYVSSYTFVPERVFSEIQNTARKFMWSKDNKKGSNKVAYEVIIQPIEVGGLKLGDLRNRVTAQRLKVLQRILDGKIPISRAYIETAIGLDAHFTLATRTNWSFKFHKSEKFWSQTYDIWSKVRKKKPENTFEMVREILWYNSYITANGETLLSAPWAEAGIRYIKDIMQDDTFMSHTQISAKYNVDCTFIDVLRIRMGIPLEWREKIAEQGYRDRPNATDHLFHLESTTTAVDFRTLSAKFLYAMLIENLLRIPAGVKKWNDRCERADLPVPDWALIHTRPYRVLRDTKMQAFCYRVIHRYIPCNVYLTKITILTSEVCHYCKEKDDISHFLLLCPKVSIFRKKVYKWIENMLDFDPSTLSEFEQMLGCERRPRRTFDVLNNLLFHLNNFIYRQRLYNKCDLSLIQWFLELKSRLRIEQHICFLEKKKAKFSKWKHIYDSL